jgi:uncharacterized protein YndB with AHSA1/START domain
MILIERSRTLEVSPDEVWEVVSSVDRLPEWLVSAERAELLEGNGLGRRQRLHGHWGKSRSEIDQRVVVWEPPRLFAWEHEAERLDGKPAPRFARSTRLSVAVEPDGAGSRVTLRSEQEPASAVRGLVMRLFARRKIAAMVEASLARLESVMSRSPAA